MPSIKAMLLNWQLTWTGHIVRMNDDRLPNVGRSHLLYMDCTKRYLHAADINKRHWEEKVHDLSEWCMAHIGQLSHERACVMLMSYSKPRRSQMTVWALAI